MLRQVLVVGALIGSLSLISNPASGNGTTTIDLQTARAGGAVLADALSLGERGKWSEAQAMAERSRDAVIKDVVLWRKLRAGKGTVSEYQDYISRRADWPGGSVLTRAVFGADGSSGRDRPRGAARANWREMSRLWKRKKYDQAERLLAKITGDEHKLGVPSLWASRRAVLVRRAAREGRQQVAYNLASQHYLTPGDGYDYSDLEWLSGWIALRRLDDPRRAVQHFERFNVSVGTPISLGRGGYWLGRAYEALGDQENARKWYAQGAKYQTSFYGQLAAAKIGAPGIPELANGTLPDWSTSPALRSDAVRAGLLLHYAGEDRLAFLMFSELGKQMDGGATLGALARLSLDLGEPHFAVRIAKHAARKGVLLYPAYYPITDLAGYASAIEPALAMALARQETELNERAVSPAGARGLMQLMPRTAKRVAGWIGEKYSRDRLIEDWRYNARLGQTYLARRINQFSGSYVLAAAAYNAGASRVDKWIAAYGDPRLSGTDMIDWIETIPFSETRNYVQRVMEGVYVYRSRLGGEAGPMTIEQDLARGLRS
ncbi:MAG: lytic transglycosylase domain-containing protein [Paracoccaceae bacterium]|nr:lytic transglycosylase domain-containing protein [Paracoccaceae bacterium]